MGFFKRLFSADYRAAVSAEAAGDLELAAERYALAGQIPAAVRVHMARATRAETRADEIAALYDALHWAEQGTPCYRASARALGRALLARARAEGIGTPRDRQKVRESAWLLCEAGDFEAAAQALESIGDQQGAADAYRRGGMVENMEAILLSQEQEAQTERAVRDEFARYELCYRGGQRDEAREALEACARQAEAKAEYRRLLDDLESRMITGGHLVLKPRRGDRVVISSRETVWLGRDGLCDLVLRSGGVSRKHARIDRAAARGDEGGDEGGDAPHFTLRDAGSRAGTSLGGLPVAGAVPLVGAGEIGLGDQTALAFELADGDAVLAMEVISGLDAGTRLLCGPEDVPISLERAGLSAQLVMRAGRPHFSAAGEFSLAGERIAKGEAQLIRGDVLAVGNVELEVA